MTVKRQLMNFWPLIAYVVLIFFLSSRPYFHAPGPDFEAKDKVAHGIEYFFLGILLFRGIGWSASRDRLMTFLFLFAVGVSVGALDELFQSYIPGRTMSVTDWLADATGIAAGVGLFVLTPLGRNRRRTAAVKTSGGRV